ncbi:MAG: glycosyltransferase 87 family protein, partial [Patescibacteria group bacterium]
LFRKRFVLAGIFFLLSISLNWTLFLFTPVYVIYYLRYRNYRISSIFPLVSFALIPLIVLLGYLILYITKHNYFTNFPKYELYNLPWIIYRPLHTFLTDSSVGSQLDTVAMIITSIIGFIVFCYSVVYCTNSFFTLRFKLKISGRLFIYTSLIILFTASMIFINVSFPFTLLFMSVYLFLITRLYKSRFITTERITTSMLSLYFLFIIFIPGISPGNFIWLILLALISHILNPGNNSKYQLILINLLVFIGLFIFYGTTSNEPVRGVYFFVFKSIFSAGFVVYSLWYINSMYKINYSLNNIKTKVREYFLKRNKVFMIGLLVLLNLSLIPSFGSPDHTAWTEYTVAAIRFGPFKGQTLIEQHYPPLSTFIMWLPSWVGEHLGFSSSDYTIPIKISIFIFYSLTVICFFVFTKSKKIGSLSGLDKILIILSTFSLILHTQALSEIDIYVMPFVILSIFLLFKNKLLWSGIFLGLAISIKWQPLILLLLFILKLVDIKISRQNIRNLTVFLVGFVIVPLISWGLVFRHPLGGKAFDTAISFVKGGMPMFSGQALNINWVITYILHAFFPQPNSGIETLADLQYLNRQIPTSIVPQFLQGQLFKVALVFILIKFWLSKKKELVAFLGSAVMIYFSHHQLNHSAYEKHLFYVVAFMLLLFLNKPTDFNRKLLILVDVITFVNMILFYGITGPRDFNRLFYGFDLSIIFSLLYFIIFLWFFWGYAKKRYFHI